MRGLYSLVILSLWISTSWAAPTVDGTTEFTYGPALAVQTVETGFGDDNPNNGSEWDAAYATFESGKLYLMLTGNLESNFNKLEIFIDSKPGGQSVFDSSGNDGAGAMDGLVFDAGFTADYHLIIRRGHDNGNDKFDIDFANLGAQSASGYQDIMDGHTGSGSTGTGVNAAPIEVGYNNDNTAGVLGGSNAANQGAAVGVLTGLELAISLSDLGNTGEPIRIMVGQNNQDHNYWSNQFLGGLAAPQGNLGSDGFGNFTGSGAINMTAFAGDQFFTVTPLPGDYNGDKHVDAADYVVWRDTNGTPAKYAEWRAHFGAGPSFLPPCPSPFCDVGSGASENADFGAALNTSAIPEPSTLLFTIAALAPLSARRWKPASRNR